MRVMRGWLAVGLMVGVAAAQREAVGGSGGADFVIGAGAAHREQALGVDAGRWQSVVAKLGSEDFREREVGQKELAKAGARDRGVIRGLAEGAVDPEVQARLMKRWVELGEEEALDPPGVSLDVRDATMTELAGALSQATGLAIGVEGENGRRYGVRAVERPFWEVFEELSAQGGLSLASGRGLVLVPKTPGVEGGERMGPYLVFADHSAAQDGTGPMKGAWRLGVSVGVDPRVPVVRYRPVEVTSVVDGKGRELVKRAAFGAAAATAGWRASESQVVYRGYAALELPEGTLRVARVKGAAHFSVAVARQRAEVADLQKQGNAAVTVGTQTVVFTRCQVGGRQLAVSGRVVLPGGAALMPGWEVQVALYDAGGHTLATGLASETFNLAFVGVIRGPVRAVLTAPTKVRDVDVPFELKDVSLW